MKRRSAVVALVCAATIALGAPPAAAISFSPSEFILGTTAAEAETRSNYNTRIAADGSGFVVAVWSTRDSVGGATGELRSVAARSTDSGSTWGPAIPLAPARATANGLTAVASYAPGRFIVVFNLCSPGPVEVCSEAPLYESRSLDGGLTWSTPARVNPAAPSGSEGELAAIASDGSDGVVIATQTDSAVLAYRSDDGGATWSGPVAAFSQGVPRVDVSANGAGEFGMVVVPRPVGGTADHIVYTTVSSDGGASWTPAVRVSEPGSGVGPRRISRVRIRPGASGGWTVVYPALQDFSREIVANRSDATGTIWLGEKKVADVAVLAHELFPIVENVGGSVWVAVWVGDEDRTGTHSDPVPLFNVSVDDGASWDPVAIQLVDPVWAASLTSTASHIDAVYDGAQLVAAWSVFRMRTVPGFSRAEPDADIRFATTFGGICGNANLDSDETCDDGNAVGGDGCGSDCQIEACWECVGSPSVCSPSSEGDECDDGEECTTEDECDGAGTCVSVDVPDGTACGFFGFCEPPGQCTSGVCTPGSGPGVLCGACEVCAEDFGGQCVPSSQQVGCFRPLPFNPSQFQIRIDLFEPKRNRFTFKWKGEATELAQFGDPNLDAYRLCLTAEGNGFPDLIGCHSTLGGDRCSGKPCWKSSAKGHKFRYRGEKILADRTMLRKVQMKPGVDGKASIKIVGKGGRATTISDLSNVLTPVRIQFAIEGGARWEAWFDTADFKSLESGVMKAKASGPGGLQDQD